jgi:hypothetical protein
MGEDLGDVGGAFAELIAPVVVFSLHLWDWANGAAAGWEWRRCQPAQFNGQAVENCELIADWDLSVPDRGRGVIALLGHTRQPAARVTESGASTAGSGRSATGC